MEQENRERIVKLEAALSYNREHTDYQLAGIQSRLHTLENRPSTVERTFSHPVFKLLLAIGLTFLAFLLTGDPKSGLGFLGLGMPR